jgi:hypothetical protein
MAVEQYQVKTSNRFAPLENSDKSKDTNTAGESTRENIKTPAKERLGQYKRKLINHGFTMNDQHFKTKEIRP